MKKRTNRCFLVLLAALLLLVGILTACGKEEGPTETPDEVLADVLKKTAEDRKTEEFTLLKSAYENGSLAYTLSLGEDEQLPTLSGKTYFSKKVSEVALTKGGSTFSSTVFSDRDKLIFTASPLNGAYGADLSELAHLMGQIDASFEAAVDLEAKLDDIGDLGDSILAIVRSDEVAALLETHSVVFYQLGEDDLTVRLIIHSLDIAAIMDSLITICENDEDFVSDLNTVLEMVHSGDEPAPTFDTLLKDMDMEDVIEDLEEENGIFTLDITATRSRVIKKAVARYAIYETDAEGNDKLSEERFTCEVILGDDGAFLIDAQSTDGAFYLDYDVDDTESRRKVSISAGTDGIVRTPVTYTYQKNAKTYSLEINIPSVLSATLTGRLEIMEDEITLTVENASYTATGGSLIGGLIPMQIPVSLSLTVKANDTPPTAPESHRDLSSLSEEERAELVDAVKNDPVIADLITLLTTLGESFDFDAIFGDGLDLGSLLGGLDLESLLGGLDLDSILGALPDSGTDGEG